MALALHLTLAWFLQFLLNDRAIRTAMRVHQGSGDSQTIEGSSGLEALQSWAGAESTMVSPETMLSDVSVPLEGSAKPNTHPSPISLHSSSRSPSGGNLDRNDEGSRRLSQQSGKAHMSRPSDSSTTSTATVSSTRPLFLHGIRPARSSYEMHRPHRPSMESPAFSSINHEVIPEHDLDRPASPPSRPHLSRVISDPMLSKERRSLEMERESVLEGPKTISSPVRIEDGETKEEMGSPSDSPSGSPPLMGSGALAAPSLRQSVLWGNPRVLGPENAPDHPGLHAALLNECG
ncbi:hypothetical protein BJ684DRAFT_15205 [Piptocephalis cylindrospora]|uniref:Uncharacterized protein n=1 Tax=Piptocephalis cylindrospora TaxID=1907219 RepID=A0A4P9Y840_9FUNG|nr:hypothetical protein BJ684DRAFT_15205 [Piptocephalis cylindrospora]|eukprot:RKP14471.1 hypothetical protein BJ684DRAFT_15205 [Piptocephalis cylindrospora]